MTWPLASTLQDAVEQAEARYLERARAIREDYMHRRMGVVAQAQALAEAMADIETDVSFWHVWNGWDDTYTARLD
ncbi:MAG: hypothetical protein ACTSX8_02860 [Alphaproteobacteria bacterium]